MSSIYKTWDEERIENLLSNFLISSWSYSKVSAFARNEKAFEMQYIYNQKSKSSATTVAGQAYHFALDRFFNAKKSGDFMDLPMLEKFAYEFIDEYKVQFWKTQKTTPSVDDCKTKCLATTNALLKNFFGELSTYIADIKEVIEVEVYCDEWLTINGVDIPMPCHAKIDLVVLTVRDTIAIIDHKSKQSYTDEQDLKLQIGVQAITYVNCYESKSGLNVDEVWFVENKYSKNKDGSPQLSAFILAVDANVRRLYEAILYSPLKRLISAVNDPDHDYIINESDNFIDKAEIYDFWAKTMIAEIEEFNIDPKKKDLIEKRLRKVRDVTLTTINPQIIKEFKKNASDFIQYDLSNKNMTPEEKIKHALRTFSIIVEVAHTFDGYSSNTFLLEVSAGVKVASIFSHKLDLANALDVTSVRISQSMVIHGGKSYLAVEIAKKREKTLLYNPADRVGYKIPIGRDNYGNVIVWDLDNHSTPHALVCGATGSGKSVSIMSTVAYCKEAGCDRIVILDPKYEFCALADNVVEVYNEIIAIEEVMAELVVEMNNLVKTATKKKIVVIFDEFADAVSASRKGVELEVKELVQVGNYAPKKDPMFGVTMPAEPKMAMKKTGELKSLEENLQVLLQKGRSTGFRIMSATQRASTKIINGDAKVNFPVQICFRVPKEADSRVVLDEGGAESLGGQGDGLMKSPEYKETVRFQAYYKA